MVISQFSDEETDLGKPGLVWRGTGRNPSLLGQRDAQSSAAQQQ